MDRDKATRGCGCGSQVTTRAASRGGSGCDCGTCPSCVGLQVLCRPRFFDGQLLSAADLSALDAYVVAKDRLHNRYLHGTGVVCGLEVVCSPCDDTVTVRPGYALGPCGEDIVVPADARVDVAGLIREQRRARARDCSPYASPPGDCEGARQQWVLGICYDECASGATTSLKARGGGSGGCGCGGSGGCGGNGGGCGGSGGCSGGCGSGGGGSAGGRRAAGPACEPTRTCEGFRFTLTRVPSGKASPVAVEQRRDLPGRVAACLARIRESLTQLPQDPTTAQLVDYACQLRADLGELLATGSVHDCTLGQRLGQVVCPDPDDQDAAERARAAVAELLRIAVEVYRDCLCSALLPPCPDDCADECVPLAVLTVRSSDLKVLEVCNWSARRFAVTMPTLQYWLGWLPIFGAVRQAVERLCCGELRRPGFQVDSGLRVSRPIGAAAGAAATGTATPGAATPGAAATTGPATTGAAATTAPAAFAALARTLAAQWSPLSGLESTVLGTLGAHTPQGGALASPLELDNPLAALALGQVGARAAATLVPDDLLAGLSTGLSRAARRAGQPGAAQPVGEQPVGEQPAAGRPGAAQPEPGGADRIAALERAVAELSTKVESQARTIRSLRENGPDR